LILNDNVNFIHDVYFCLIPYSPWIAENCGLVNRVSKYNYSGRLNALVFIELLTVYVSPFLLMNYVKLLAYVHATFKAEHTLQTYFCSVWEKLSSWFLYCWRGSKVADQQIKSSVFLHFIEFNVLSKFGLFQIL
jgi:hypothetical protein